MSRCLLCLVLVAACAASCASPWHQSAPPVMTSNPLVVPAANDEVLWERTVDVLHDFHFEIAREDRFSRIIETEYRTGSGVLEPWHQDSVGWDNRMESTLQSVRRKLVLRLLPDDRGNGYLVSVEAFKELEDLPGIAANSAGGATFQESTPLQRDLNQVVGQSSPSGWISVGRDASLEQAVLERLRLAYSQS